MSEPEIDIHKAAGIIIQDRKLLVERSSHKDVFVAPGGKIEDGETPKQAAVRELEEEFTINVEEGDLNLFGTFYATAAGNSGKRLRMDVFTVGRYSGTIQPASEVEEIAWITSQIPVGMKVGSIFEHEVIPRLKAQNLID